MYIISSSEGEMDDGIKKRVLAHLGDAVLAIIGKQG